jgi:hypothetical protein
LGEEEGLFYLLSTPSIDTAIHVFLGKLLLVSFLFNAEDWRYQLLPCLALKEFSTRSLKLDLPQQTNMVKEDSIDSVGIRVGPETAL